MPKPQNRQASIDSRRIELEREIVIRLPAFDTFVTEYSTNISTTGMFVASDNPQPPGTTFAFEFSVADDWKLIRGKGQVVWSRYSKEGQTRPPGMGIRYTELDGQSRRLIRWIVEKHIREGGTPFELEDLRTEVDQVLESALDEEEAPPPSTPGPRAFAAETDETAAGSGRPWGLVALLLSGAVVVAILAGILWMSEPDEPRAASVEVPAASPGPTRAAATPSSTEPPTETPAGPDLAAAPALVTAWSRDWSAQRPDRYLAHYAAEFEPPNGLSRGAWEAIRRERLTTPGSIAIGITALETNELAPGRVEALFTQTYRSDLLDDVVRKRVELVWEAQGWKIASEEVVSVLE